MNNRILLAVLLLFATKTLFSQCLSGQYTLGQQGDFENFDSLQNALDNFGVCGPTRILLLPGRHLGGLVLSQGMGINLTNTLEFELCQYLAFDQTDILQPLTYSSAPSFYLFSCTDSRMENSFIHGTAKMYDSHRIDFHHNEVFASALPSAFSDGGFWVQDCDSLRISNNFFYDENPHITLVRDVGAGRTGPGPGAYCQ